MNETIRHLKYGLCSIIVMFFTLTSVALSFGNFSDTEWAATYFAMSGLSFLMYRFCFRPYLVQMRTFENAVRSVRCFHLATSESKIRQIMADMIFFRHNDTVSIVLASWYVSEIEDKKTLEAIILELCRYRMSNAVISLFQKRLRLLIAGHDEEWIDSYLTDELQFGNGFPIDKHSIDRFRQKVEELMMMYAHSQSVRIINARVVQCVREHPRESTTFDELWAMVDPHRSQSEG